MPKTNFGQGKFSRFGQGAQLQEYPKNMTAKWRSFKGGRNTSDNGQDVSEDSSPTLLDMIVDRKDRLRKAPGTALVEDLTTHSPTQLMLHAGLNFRSEMLMFAGSDLGVKSDAGTTWMVGALDGSTRRYFSATYGEDFIFGNGNGLLKVKKPSVAEVKPVEGAPNGTSLCTAVARLFVGGAQIDGNTEPLGISWSGTQGYDDWDIENGAGAELLISDQTYGDRIVAIRAIGFDFVAILCRKNLWVGRKTGEVFRPLDFQPRITGKGCVSQGTVAVAFGGVIYLSDEGVEIFDGNQSTHISDAIDSELLPLDAATLSEYSSSFNPHTQEYALYTPSATFIFDSLRNRWYKRSLVVSGGVPFAQQFHEVTWGELIGSWADQGDETWREYSPAEVDVPVMHYIKGHELHKDSQSSFVNFGEPFVPTWGSPVGQGPQNHNLFTYKEIRIDYEGSGTVKVFLPDDDSQYQEAGTIPLLLRTFVNLARVFGIRSGRGVGIQLTITAGDPLISGFEVDAMVRAMRIEGDLVGTFNPDDFSQKVTVLVLPSDFHPPANAVEFVKQGSVSSPAAGAIAIPGASFTVPTGMQAVIKRVTLFANDATQATNLIWALRRDGAPVPSHSTLTLFPRDASSEAGEVPANVKAASGVTVDVEVTNNDGAAHLVGASFYGWYWPND